MNYIAIIILAAILVEFFLGLIADYLNLKHLKKDLPHEFSDVFDEDKYRKSQEYTLTRTRFGFISSVWSLLILLVLWFTGGFEALDQAIRTWGYGEIINGLIYFSVITTGYSILRMPFSLYGTFVIEERFGFNKTTFKTWVSDLVKSTLLSAIIGLPLLAGIIAVFVHWGSGAWLIGWIGIALISLALQYIAPTWIMPLFNKFTPLEDGELRERILRYSEKVDFPLKQVYVMDGSKRSARSNAFFTGFGKNKRIALFDTLIEKHTVDELVAIVAHEVGHYKKKHIIKGTVISLAHSGILLFLLGLILEFKPLYEAFYISEPSVYLGLIFFGMLYKPVEMVLSVLMNLLSRKHEYEADAWAAETDGNPAALIAALKKLSADNLSNLTPHPLYVFLNYSHPPVLSRIGVLEKR